MLGYIPLAAESVVVVLCRTPCANQAVLHKHVFCVSRDHIFCLHAYLCNELFALCLHVKVIG